MLQNAIKLRERIQKARQGRFPVVFVSPGSGQVAKAAAEGGAHFLMLLNSGLFRSAGVSSLGSFLPYGNANDQTEFLIRNQIFPRVRNIPLVAGMMPCDPATPVETRLRRMIKLGIAGIINWPTVGITDGSFRQIMHMEGLTIESEIEMLSQAGKMGFMTFGFAFTPMEVVMLAEAGTEILVLNVGWTRETKDIYEKADRVEYAVMKINEMLRALRGTGKNPTCLFYGGAAILPEDSAVIYQRCQIQGHGGGSSYERIPVAKLIIDNVRKFLSVPRHAESNQHELGSGKLIGISPPMIELNKLIKRAAPFDVNVCIEGESGSGKELVASQIHKLSNRNAQPFITLNCGAIPETLLESEFFGHEKGAFTGAVNRRLGKFELADQGTLFLDEVAELSPKAQVSLLRVLQQKEIIRVGGEKAIPVNPRIITATHQDLKSLVEQSRFRTDLYFRLNMITLKVPPLRQHIHDLPTLVSAFLNDLGLKFDRKIIGVSQDFMSRLKKHNWPGNVRELKHVLTRVILMEDGPILHGNDFLPDSRGVTIIPGKIGIDMENSEGEANFLKNVLQSAGGNKSKAAIALGISRKTLYVRLKKANLF